MAVVGVLAAAAGLLLLLAGPPRSTVSVDVFPLPAACPFQQEAMAVDLQSMRLLTAVLRVVLSCWFKVHTLHTLYLNCACPLPGPRCASLTICHLREGGNDSWALALLEGVVKGMCQRGKTHPARVGVMEGMR